MMKATVFALVLGLVASQATLELRDSDGGCSITKTGGVLSTACALESATTLGLEGEISDLEDRVDALETIHSGNPVNSGPFSSCSDAFENGQTTTGYQDLVVSGVSMNVYCDQVTDGGGWEVFQRRTSGSLSFEKTWVEYANGFGDGANFWLGNDNLATLTAQGYVAGNTNMRVDLGYNGETRHALYQSFQVGSASNKYRSAISGYSGDAGDSMTTNDEHSGKDFTTFDSDNDAWSNNCAQNYKGGWWYGSCHYANLNGVYHGGAHSSYADGVNWYHWQGYQISLTVAEMKVRIGGRPEQNVCPASATVYNHCTHAKQSGMSSNGFYCINPDNSGKFMVYCDQTTDNGGWEVFQRRVDGSVDFYETFASYEGGFGNDREFWLGLTNMKKLSPSSELRMDLWSGAEHRYANYNSFSLTGDKYVLNMGSYSGNAGDSMTTANEHNGKAFTTYDSDNDAWSNNCAENYKGGWWYGSCHYANLNGLYLDANNHDHSSYADGFNWYHWKGYQHSLRKTEMKVRFGGAP